MSAGRGGAGCPQHGLCEGLVVLVWAGPWHRCEAGLLCHPRQLSSSGVRGHPRQGSAQQGWGSLWPDELPCSHFPSASKGSRRLNKCEINHGVCARSAGDEANLSQRTAEQTLQRAKVFNSNKEVIPDFSRSSQALFVFGSGNGTAICAKRSGRE